MFNVKLDGEFPNGLSDSFLLPVQFVIKDGKITGAFVCEDGLQRTLCRDAHEQWLRTDGPEPTPKNIVFLSGEF